MTKREAIRIIKVLSNTAGAERLRLLFDKYYELAGANAPVAAYDLDTTLSRTAKREGRPKPVAPLMPFKVNHAGLSFLNNPAAAPGGRFE